MRRYEAFDVAETPTGSSELVGSGEGFNALAGYIFGDAKQAMTTPGARRAGARTRVRVYVHTDARTHFHTHAHARTSDMHTHTHTHTRIRAYAPVFTTPDADVTAGVAMQFVLEKAAGGKR